MTTPRWGPEERPPVSCSVGPEGGRKVPPHSQALRGERPPRLAACTAWPESRVRSEVSSFWAQIRGGPSSCPMPRVWQGTRWLWAEPGTRAQHCLPREHPARRCREPGAHGAEAFFVMLLQMSERNGVLDEQQRLDGETGKPLHPKGACLSNKDGLFVYNPSYMPGSVLVSYVY